MRKPYEWKEIENFLRKALDKSEHILTFGTIGSCNVENDIDIIITKKPLSPSSKFYKEVHKIFDSLEHYLKIKYNHILLRFPGGSQGELINLSKKRRNALVIESMIYTSFPQIRKDWEWAMFNDESVSDILKKQNFLFGNFSDLFAREFQTPKYSDPVFIYLYRYDRINSNYPKKLLLDIMNKHYDYLYRKRLGLKAPICKKSEDIRKAFYELCDKLDALEMKKKLK